MPDAALTEHTHRITRQLERPLTDAERLEIGVNLSEALEAAQDAERRKRELDGRLKKDIDYYRGMADDLAGVLRKGVREGPVEVLVTRDWTTGRVTFHRADTGEQIEERAMTIEERQTTIPEA